MRTVAECMAQAAALSAKADITTDALERSQLLAMSEAWLDLAQVVEVESVQPLTAANLLCELALDVSRIAGRSRFP